MDGVARGMPSPMGVGGVLHNTGVVVLATFSKHVSILKSNETKVLALLEALGIFVPFSHFKLVVESDLLSAFFWVSFPRSSP